MYSFHFVKSAIIVELTKKNGFPRGGVRTSLFFIKSFLSVAKPRHKITFKLCVLTRVQIEFTLELKHFDLLFAHRNLHIVKMDICST